MDQVHRYGKRYLLIVETPALMRINVTSVVEEGGQTNCWHGAYWYAIRLHEFLMTIKNFGEVMTFNLEGTFPCSRNLLAGKLAGDEISVSIRKPLAKRMSFDMKYQQKKKKTETSTFGEKK